jgi:hypothetical protein
MNGVRSRISDKGRGGEREGGEVEEGEGEEGEEEEQEEEKEENTHPTNPRPSTSQSNSINSLTNSDCYILFLVIFVECNEELGVHGCY